MCGLVAVFKPEGFPAGWESALERARDRLAHRGPDDRGLWISEDRACGLAHRRLSILDLSSAGHQPMTDADGRVSLVYNGECYNFAELRRDLEDEGYAFRSRTDTEVIVNGYLAYGPEMISRLRGMFSLVLYDREKRRLLLARDRVGIKPLYYTHAEGALLVASEIKALLSFPEVVRALNPDALKEYLAFGQVYGPHSMFSGIYKFPAAHFAVVEDAGSLQPRRFWSPLDEGSGLPADADEAFYAEELLQRLEESVRLRMLSDVPVGVFLSGGVDSTANVALMSRVSGSKVHSFTVGFQGQEAYDERRWARIAAKHFKTEHEELEISQADMGGCLEELSHFLEEPVADPTVIPIYFISKLARESGAIVILNGDGADELFCGYKRWMRFLRLLPFWRLLNGMPRASLKFAANLSSRIQLDRRLVDLLDRAGQKLPLYTGGAGAFRGTALFRELFHGPGSRDPFRALREQRALFEASPKRGDEMAWFSFYGLFSEVEHGFLYRADRLGMAHSIEVRVPFLDQRVVELAMRMPQRLKHLGGETKHILKRALAGVVPDELLYRRKQGFCVPVREWTGEWARAGGRDLIPRLQREWQPFSPVFAEQAQAFIQSNRINGFMAWNLFSLAAWYRHWFHG